MSCGWGSSRCADSAAGAFLQCLVADGRSPKHSVRCGDMGTGTTGLASPMSPCLQSLRRIPIVEPRLRGVRVAAHLPEAFLVLREELDLADPLRALPGVQLRRDHAARAAVFARQHLSSSSASAPTTSTEAFVIMGSPIRSHSTTTLRRGEPWATTPGRRNTLMTVRGDW